MTIVALGLFSVSVAALAAARSTLGLAGAGLLFGTAQGIVYPTLNAFTVEGVPVEELGRAQTFYNGAFNLGTTTGSLALGHVAERAGHRMMFLIAAAVVATAFVVFSVGTGARFREPRRTHPGR